MSGRITLTKLIDKVGINKGIKEITTAIDGITAAFNKAAKAGKKVADSVGGTDSLKKLLLYQKQLAEASDKRAAAKKKEVNATKNLTTAQKENLKIEKQVEVLKARQTASYKKLNAEKQKLSALQSKENKQIRDQVTGQKGLRASLGKLVKSVGAYAVAAIGLQKVISFFSNTLLTTTKRFDSLGFTMRQIITEDNELIATKTRLNKISADYGLNILSMTERYIKFRAASKSANLSATATMHIFEAAAKSASVLGLRTDETNGVFLALEQMLSKGKVTTEELRRQLGERLPGAFGMMADALGVTLPMLDKMLKNGEIISSEALPKLAKQMEIAFGLDSVNRINTLAAAQERLRSSWANTQDAVKAGSVYKGIFGVLTDMVNAFRLTFDDSFTELEYYLTGGGAIGKKVREIADELDDVDFKIIEDPAEQQRLLEDWQASFKGVIIDQATINKMFDDYIKKRKELNTLEEESKGKTQMYDVKTLRQKLSDAENEYKAYNGIIEADLKTRFANISSYIDDNVNSIDKFYKKELTNMRILVNESWLAYSELEEKKKTLRETNAGVLTKEEQIEMATQYSNYQNYVKGVVLLQEKLKTKDNMSFFDKEMIKGQTELANEERRLIDARTKLLSDSLGMRELEYKEVEARSQEQLNIKMTKNEIDFVRNMLAIAGEQTKEHYDLKKKEAELLLKLQEQRGDSEINGAKRINDIIDRNEKEHSAGIVDEAYEWMDVEQTARIAHLADRVENERLSSDKIQKLRGELALANIKTEIDETKNMIKYAKLVPEEKKRQMERLAQLEKQYEEQRLNNAIDTNEKTTVSYSDMIDGIGELYSKLFEFLIELQNRQLEHAKMMYEAQTKEAGTSIETKIRAEREYEKEQKKINKRIDYIEKAQALFNIGLEIAQLEVRAAALDPLAIIGLASAVGTAATVLATPIPAYKYGGDHKGGVAQVSEEGSELFIPDGSGNAFLTPTSTTIGNFPAGKFIPHDETQRILNEFNANQSHTLVDMSDTNNYLSGIERNTKNRDSVSYENGYKTIRRGNTISRIRV